MILLLNRQSTDLSCYSSSDCRKRIHEDADEAVNHGSDQADCVDGESQQRLKGRNGLNGDNITKSTKWKKHKI